MFPISYIGLCVYSGRLFELSCAEEIKTPKNVVYTEGAAENMEIDSTVESESESQMEPESEPEPEIVEADCQHISTN